VFLREGGFALCLIREVQAVWMGGVSPIRSSRNRFDAGTTFVPTGWVDSLSG
jgi:hypothetical protein